MAQKHTLVDHLTNVLLGASQSISSRSNGEDITISDIPEVEFGLVAGAIKEYVSSNSGTLLSERRTRLTHDVAYQGTNSIPVSITTTHGPSSVRISIRDLY